MTTPDRIGAGGVSGTGAGGLAAGPGDDQGERPVVSEAERGSPTRAAGTPSSDSDTPAGAPGTAGGLAAGGGSGPDFTQDDEQTAADETTPADER
jgi:hypothetical protein